MQKENLQILMKNTFKCNKNNMINAFYWVPSELQEIPVIIVAMFFQCSYVILNLISCELNGGTERQRENLQIWIQNTYKSNKKKNMKKTRLLFYRVPSETQEIPVIIVANFLQCSYLVVNLISCGLLHKPLGSVSFCEHRHSFGN